MTASNQEAVNEVYENIFTRLWRDSCGDYLNFGRFTDQCTTLTEANDTMVDWIIEHLNITKESRLLDIGCGRGKYAIEIARKTGCTFKGIDIVAEFVESGNELISKTQGISGELCVGNMLALSETLGAEEKFTHVMALGCLFYVHDKMALFLNNLVPHCAKDATLLIHDFSRNAPLEQVQDVLKHWRTTSPLLETQNYLETIEKNGFKVSFYNDDTAMGLKSCQWVVDVAATLSSDTTTFTFWVLRDALKARRILHNTIIATVPSEK